jgi:hypothetical protein
MNYEHEKVEALQDIAKSLKNITDALYITKQDGSKISIAQMVNSIGFNLKKP